MSEDTIDVSLPRLLEETVERYGSRPVMASRGHETSYEQLLEESERLASALAAEGVAKGDRVALMLPNCPEYVVSFFAVARLGAIVTQVNPIYTEQELKHIIDDSAAETIILHKQAYPMVAAVRDDSPLERVIVAGEAAGVGGSDTDFDRFLESAPGMAPAVKIDPGEDLAVIQYTGGTTGVSKGAMLTHHNLLCNIEQNVSLMMETPGTLEGGKSVAVAPFFHIFGTTVVLLTSIRYGMNMLLVRRFQIEEMMELIKRERPAMLAGVATIFTALHGYPDMESYGLDEILLYVSGGASVPIDLLESFKRRTGRPLFEGYGLSEGAPVSINTYLRGPVPGSIGIPMPSTDMRIVDEETGTEEMPLGELGELVVKGPQVMQGYWNMPDETTKTLRDGWLHTGDIARMEENGYFYIVDRKKDVIIASGYNVYPREVEEVLYRHSEVVEAVAVGVPDEYRGETVKAFVVKKEGSTLTEEELLSYCKENLAAYKVPKLLEFRDELPKSAVGKILKRVLSEEERQDTGDR
ncbi:MAG TPA: long-chain fatty acid--CoA ligase [Rubrobacter sp.]|nr:long-chain fatty acid--CoA ligase [Rubrobacter sp.]